MILSFCDTPNVMEVFRIVNIVITIVKIVIPILLIISVMLEFMNGVTTGETGKIGGAVAKKIIAAILIFLVPTLVSIIFSVIAKNSDYKNCLKPASKEEIRQMYITREEEYVSATEKSVDINDYNRAINYLSNIKDIETKKGFSKRLAEVKKKIDEKSREKGGSSGGGNYPTQTYGNCEFVQKTAGGMSYGICVPKNYNNESIPMIVWLHGSGEVGASFETFKWSGMLAVVNNWSLKEIPAIIVAPQCSSGDWTYKGSNVKTVMDDVISKYNINKSKIALIGHSMGGRGVPYIAAANQSYFSCLVMLSAYISEPPSSATYFKGIPIKGYSEEAGGYYAASQSFFRSVGKENELRKMNCSHGEVPGQALRLDENGDGISDLIYWMLSW